MRKSKFTDTQIMDAVKRVEAGFGVPDICREMGISTATLYKWRAKYGGMDVSMISHMKELEEENRRLKKMYLGRSVKPSVSNFGNKFEVLDPFISQNLLEDSISIEVPERLGSSWHEWFGRLQGYAKKYGTANVASDYISGNGFKIGSWVQQQRQNQSNLTTDKRNLLESLEGWTWNAHESNWLESYLMLKRFSIEHKNCNLPTGWIDPKSKFRLYSWMVKQRASKKNLQADQIQLLESLPEWTWDSRKSKWEIGFSTLQQYINLKGDSLVPASYVAANGYKLGSWVARQRRIKSELDTDQTNSLLNLPKWSWNTKLDESKNLLKPQIKSKIGWYHINSKILHIPSSIDFNFEKLNNEDVYLLFNPNHITFKIQSNLVIPIECNEIGLKLKCYKCEKMNKYDSTPISQKVCFKCQTSFNFLNKFL